MPQKQRFPRTRNVAPDNANPLAAMLVSVANGTVTKHAVSNGRFMHVVGKVDLVEVKPRCQNKSLLRPVRPFIADNFETSRGAPDPADIGCDKLGAISFRVACHPFDQVGPCDAVVETGSIICLRNAGGTRIAVVKDDRRSAKTRRI